jgi:hypothetical protein
VNAPPANTPPDANDDPFDYTLPTSTGGTFTISLFPDHGDGADNLGNPAATVASFGGGSLGAAVTDNAPGATASFTGGSAKVDVDGTLTFSATTDGTYTLYYRLQNSVGYDDALVTVVVHPYSGGGGGGGGGGGCLIRAPRKVGRGGVRTDLVVCSVPAPRKATR